MSDTKGDDPFKDKIRVMLGEPSNGLIDSIAHDNRLDFYMELARLESRSNFKFFTGNVGRTQVNYAREMMADAAIDNDFHYLFMMDDDMIIPRRCFERVYDTLIKENADIAAPICTQRLAPFRPVMYKHSWVNSPNPDILNLKNEFIEDYEPNSVVNVDGIGFGVVLIAVPFLKKMREKMPNGMFFSNSNIGEDIWFCINAKRQLDAKIVVDTSVKVGHLKHPEMASEWDYVKSKGLQEKFKDVYDNGVLVGNKALAVQLFSPNVDKPVSVVAA